jgi:NAD(P)-dependent dehydrogenase (short-subunit alcohol dehydrogenase family)
MLLQNKVAIVTGAAQGIGKAIAKVYSTEGAQVVLCDMQEDKIKTAAAEIEKATGNKAIGMALDVTKKSEIESVVNRVQSLFGKIDILVNNAGILKHALIVDMSEKDFDKVFEVNVKGVFLFTQAVAKSMIKAKSGKIINLASRSGKKPTREEGAYCASKSAVIGFTRVTALELGPYGICCNNICPGATDTEMVRTTFMTSPEVEKEWIEKTAIKRLGKPEDIANAALFLASHLSNHITGESIVVSGGEMMTQ